jgi:hypothetical protein
MMSQTSRIAEELRTPKSAAFAGIAVALLIGLSIGYFGWLVRPQVEETTAG